VISFLKSLGYCLFFVFLFAKSPSLVYAQPMANMFELKGKVVGHDTGVIYLSYYIDKDQKVINDSSLIVDGIFNFKGNISEPTVAFIHLYNTRELGVNTTEIFLEPSTLNLTLTFNKFSEARMAGSLTQKQYEDLQVLKIPMREKFRPQLDQLDQIINNQIKGNRDSLLELLAPLVDSEKNIDYAFFLSHPTSYVTAYLLQYHIRDLSVDSLTFFYSRLGNKPQQNIVTRNVRERIEQQKVGTPGSMAKYFFAKDVNGNPLLSRLFKGKYVLLDFWVSWCVPCRENSPHIISIYSKYKEKGLAIIGVADNDNDTTAWKKAIETDGVGIWNHVLRGLNREAKLKGQRNDRDINEKFAVVEIPTMILIDRNGMIIGRYKGVNDNPALDKKLSEIFE
jgi:thiol-disulfide isomerase/thioredoxin